VGKNLPTSPADDVRVLLDEIDGRDAVEILVSGDRRSDAAGPKGPEATGGRP
jgi:hypothetical protein